MDTVSLSFHSVLCGPSLSDSCSISPQVFIRRNCSRYRLIFSMFMGEGELRVFYTTILPFPLRVVFNYVVL